MCVWGLIVLGMFRKCEHEGWDETTSWPGTIFKPVDAGGRGGGRWNVSSGSFGIGILKVKVFKNGTSQLGNVFSFFFSFSRKENGFVQSDK